VGRFRQLGCGSSAPLAQPGSRRSRAGLDWSGL
jgi:hypothetical protein